MNIEFHIYRDRLGYLQASIAYQGTRTAATAITASERDALATIAGRTVGIPALGWFDAVVAK